MVVIKAHMVTLINLNQYQVSSITPSYHNSRIDVGHNNKYKYIDRIRYKTNIMSPWSNREFTH